MGMRDNASAADRDRSSAATAPSSGNWVSMRRIATLLTSLLLAGGLTLVGPAPVYAAAPARTNGQANPVVFIHGWSPDGDADCDAYWAAATQQFAASGWTGELTTFGYYSGDTNCDITFPG